MYLCYCIYDPAGTTHGTSWLPFVPCLLGSNTPFVNLLLYNICISLLVVPNKVHNNNNNNNNIVAQ